MNIKIIIAAHKKYRMPKEPVYLPVQVGAEGKDSLGYQRDNEGENISGKNPSYCELTGMYWAWKNLKCDCKGLAHYRRHFSYKRKDPKDPFANILTAREAAGLLRKYDILLPKKRNYYIETLYSHYAHTHYAVHLDKTREIIKKKYPAYLRSFDKVMEQRSGYMFNMMIMKSKYFDSYCEWLFDILFELEKEISMPELSAFQGRFYGRVSEIIFNVWLDTQIRKGEISPDAIRELDCIYTEKIDYKRKVKSFLEAKFLHKKYEDSF